MLRWMEKGKRVRTLEDHAGSSAYVCCIINRRHDLLIAQRNAPHHSCSRQRILDHAIERRYECRLSTSGRTDHSEDFILVHREIDIADNISVIELYSDRPGSQTGRNMVSWHIFDAYFENCFYLLEDGHWDYLSIAAIFWRNRDQRN